jgi:large subunit ribosomal protein L6
MSRIGKKPIVIPKDVSICFEEMNLIVKGKYGTLQKKMDKTIQIEIQENKILVNRMDDQKKSRELHGLYRALIQNMITGVDQQFSKTLIAEGVGYRFQLEKTKLIVNVGYTNPIQFFIPEELIIKLESNTKIQLLGIDNEKVGFFAAKIRDMRPPEPYKGKGILQVLLSCHKQNNSLQ